jgi:uncharacterized membrane protein (DUF4010 family)
MVELALIQNFLAAIALGALIGLEREYARYKKRGHDYAGIRTFPLIALFGALAAYLGDLYSIYILVVSILLVGFLIIAAYFAMNKQSLSHYTGATSEIAGFLTFFLGVLAYHGQIIFAAFITIIITIILYARSVLHTFAKKISSKEMASTLKFAVVAFIILPFLPNQGYGPLEIFNPFVIWLMVVFISGISFFGYILMKWFGERGVTLAGILGGLVSSTATTMSFAARSNKEKQVYKSLALGVILANGIMFIRILIEVFVLNSELFVKILAPMLILAVITGIFSYFIWRDAEKVKGKIHLGSPFTLGPALKFGLFFALILALVKLADTYLSTKGVYLVSLISGFADVDAITVSLSQLSKGDLALDIARNGIVLATLTNVAVKGGIAWWFGGKKFGRIVLGLFSVLIIVGVGTMFFL